MKNSLFKISLAVAMLLAFCVTLASCNSDPESTEISNDLFVEENIDALSDGYASLFVNIYHTVKKEYMQIAGSDVDIDEYFEHFAESYDSRLTPEERNLINRYSNSCRTRSVDVSKDILVPEDFISQIKPIMYDENLNLLTEEINKFYRSQYFLSLNNGEQQELKIQLESLIKIRNSITEIMIDYLQSEGSKTRVSPGDRMIWSEAMKQLNDKQRQDLMNATVTGVSLVVAGSAATIVTIASWVYSLF